MDKQNISFVLGKRLRLLREKRGLSHVDLAKQLGERYGISVSRDSLMAYEISDESRSRADKLPNLGMRVEYLYCLSDFYGVSVDYLMGKSDIPTSDIKVKEICEYTGLSEESISVLGSWNNDFGIPYILDLFFQSDNADSIVESLVDLFWATIDLCAEYDNRKKASSEKDVKARNMELLKLSKIEKQLGSEFTWKWFIINADDQIDLLRAKLTRLWENFVDYVQDEAGNKYGDKECIDERKGRFIYKDPMHIRNRLERG